MSAGTGDKFSDTYNAANPNVARVTSTRAAAATSLSCDNLAGWPTSTSTKVHFSTYKINTSGAVVAGTQIDWTGIVTGNTIGSMVRVTGATDNGNAVNDVVEMNPTAKWASELVNGILVEHTQAGVHALTANSTLTSSKFITALNDTNGNELFKVTPTASAVNEFTVANAATGAGPTLSATGGDTNVDINITPKGTGQIKGVVDHLFNPYKFRVYRSAAQNTAAGTTKVLYDTKTYDTGSNFDVVTNNRFTAPVAGFYNFSATAQVASAANFQLSLFKNGTGLTNGVNGSGSGANQGSIVTDTLQLAAGDYVEVFASCGSVNALFVGSPGVYFTGFLVSTT